MTTITPKVEAAIASLRSSGTQAPNTSGPTIVLSTVYTRYTPKSVEALQWALEKGFIVDVDIETNLRAGEGAWEDLEEFLVKAIPTSHRGKIILSNILPAPDDREYLSQRVRTRTRRREIAELAS
ncbi:uncharacterized protein PHACADRAFT_203296 [Phanerochaete carnosa HHB-10118-sp]|uniref:Uncharacterized protein n=1 Tax=Phanerochaete carnosa (strain HHB-10118-sp) TaxID=650164 RepID=K5VMY9_PHACS|nr:uncharacterized protein PHACADRAFT_203296 [Phanerochaete carnosa HHB-10118-sp]EKM48065.1 hypothetical protein PHACADRAFT_203296 [Phanerochaete carnosa HHB-10118-sp]